MAIWPVPTGTPITQRFGEHAIDYTRLYGLLGHDGVDFGVPSGTPLVAVDDGTVLALGNDPAGFGTYLKLTTPDGTWVYGHLLRPLVAAGDHVSAGQQVALSDNTGNSTGPHLHLGLRPPNPNLANGFAGYVDPLPSLDGQTSAQQAPAGPSPPLIAGLPIMLPEPAPAFSSSSGRGVLFAALATVAVLVLGRR